MQNNDRLTGSAFLPRNIQIPFELSPAQETALISNTGTFQNEKCLPPAWIYFQRENTGLYKLIEEQIAGKQTGTLPGSGNRTDFPDCPQACNLILADGWAFITAGSARTNDSRSGTKCAREKSKYYWVPVPPYSCPFTDLSLVIVDEEHDSSYKQQDPAPRYHARDTAIYYASLFNAKTLLGSATPSIESYYNAVTGKYGLAELLERFGQVAMPVIQLIDTKKYFQKDGSKVICTPALQEAIQDSLNNKKQVILFRTVADILPTRFAKSAAGFPSVKTVMSPSLFTN